MRNVKNTIISKSAQATGFILLPVRVATPQSTSKAQIKIASPSAMGLRNSVPNTSKYSCSLYANDSITFIGLAGSSPKEVDNFRHDVNALYDYYITDQTVLKTMIRSNPGLMLMKNGVVIAIWHYHDIPSYDEVTANYFKK